MTDSARVEALLDELWRDLNSRRGFDAESCDRETILSWREKWRSLIARHLNATPGGGA